MKKLIEKFMRFLQVIFCLVVSFFIANNIALATERTSIQLVPESIQSFNDPAYWEGQRIFKQMISAEANEKSFDLMILGNLYANKCRDFDCYLNECDIGIPNCRNDHALLFRGEGAYPKIAVSAAVRYQLASPEYCGSDCTGSKLLELLDAYLSRRFSRKSLSLSERVAQMTVLHENSDIFSEYYEFTTVSRDPLISSTPLPSYAAKFRPAGGRILIFSVPEVLVHQKCLDKFPKPGEPILSKTCDGFNPDEPEVDFFLYVNPEYIFGVAR